MNWLKQKLRRWLEVPVPSVIQYIPSAEVVAAVGYQDQGIFIFTRRGDIYRLFLDGSQSPLLMKLMIEVPT